MKKISQKKPVNMPGSTFDGTTMIHKTSIKNFFFLYLSSALLSRNTDVIHFYNKETTKIDLVLQIRCTVYDLHIN
jgi:hypothetical protein